MTPPPLHIHGGQVENVNNKFLGLYITNDLTLTVDTHCLVKAQQRLFLLRKLKKANVPSQLLQEYNRKHSLPLYYCVVYQLHYTEPKRSCTDS